MIGTNGINWNGIWRPWLPDGETFESMVAHAADNGISYVTLHWGAGDHKSHLPSGEVRPGEFWYGGGVKRDANGDVTTPLYDATTPAPADCPLMQIFNLCAERGIKILFSIGTNGSLDDFDRHPYNVARVNAVGNPCRMGEPGWLAQEHEFFSDARARAAFKRRIDAFITSFGGHSALWAIDLGNEFSFRLPEDFSPQRDAVTGWLMDISGYLWDALPGPDYLKPLIGVSQMRLPVEHYQNACPAYLDVPADKRLLIWHTYSTTPRTLLKIAETAHEWLTHAYPGSTLCVGSGWPWAAPGPRPLEDTARDINIPECAYADPEGSFEPTSAHPYRYERMFAALAAATPGFAKYTRWRGYVDDKHTSFFQSTTKRLAEIMRPCAALQAAEIGAVYHSIAGDFTFQSAARTSTRVNFVLVGEGLQVVDFGVSGTWHLTTYQWDADDVTVEFDGEIVDGQAVIDFDAYSDGFCMGVLELVDDTPPPPPDDDVLKPGAVYRQVVVGAQDGVALVRFEVVE